MPVSWGVRYFPEVTFGSLLRTFYALLLTFCHLQDHFWTTSGFPGCPRAGQVVQRRRCRKSRWSRDVGAGRAGGVQGGVPWVVYRARVVLLPTVSWVHPAVLYLVSARLLTMGAGGVQERQLWARASLKRAGPGLGEPYPAQSGHASSRDSLRVLRARKDRRTGRSGVHRAEWPLINL